MSSPVPLSPFPTRPRSDSSPPRRTLLYFGHVPMEGAGSAIIVLRHLRRFSQEGWDVRIVADWGQDHALCHASGWPVTQLPHRQWWWLPFNHDQGVSRKLRAWLWAGEAARWLGDTKVDGVLTYLSAFSDTLSIAAVGFAERYNLPLATLVHDDSRCFTADAREAELGYRRRQWIVEHSTVAWFASPQLAACYKLPAQQIGVLPPIPEGAPPAPEAHALAAPLESPLLIYAGNYWPPQLSTLAAIAAAARGAGGRLLAVLKEDPAHVAFLKAHQVEWRRPFPLNTEALDYYRENASALVVSYSTLSTEMPWTRTSFPSKLIEYCHLALPILIVAPEDTAVMQWARLRNFPDAFLPEDTASISNYVARLRDPSFRRERANLARSFARGEFDPVSIQNQLANSFSRISQ